MPPSESGLNWHARPSALPSSALSLYGEIARLDNFTVGILYEYKRALGGEVGRGPIGQCIQALPSLVSPARMDGRVGWWEGREGVEGQRD